MSEAKQDQKAADKAALEAEEAKKAAEEKAKEEVVTAKRAALLRSQKEIEAKLAEVEKSEKGFIVTAIHTTLVDNKTGAVYTQEGTLVKQGGMTLFLRNQFKTGKVNIEAR